MSEFSHIDEHGKASMVDVSAKPDQLRTAYASGKIILQEATIKLITENQIKKGEVITVCEIAGIQAAKQTSALIPLCHPLMLTKVDVKATIEGNAVVVKSMVRCKGQTGVEMEALTAVTVALLTVYDMCKAVDKTMRITDIVLDKKEKLDL
ncbi:MAG: cyclic pyranopterin monophosphate synthase MoaC [Bacteroidetes bacterium]|nr:cyclic pyranopterin monophosphate synthase MoaC [Bacteroidota bacterium]MBU1719520.1 cyclic pyranopterin monophosphate synthase MoaC [Bacteroidota bacterium]